MRGRRVGKLIKVARFEWSGGLDPGQPRNCGECQRLGKLKHKREGMCFVVGTRECRREQLRSELPPLTIRAATAFAFFQSCGTQWRVGIAGATGLDYTACRIVARQDGFDFDWVWTLFRLLEIERLAFFFENAEREREEDRKRSQKSGSDGRTPSTPSRHR